MTSNPKNSALKTGLLSLAMAAIMAAPLSATAASASNNGSAKNNYLLPNGAGNNAGAPFILINPTLTIGSLGLGSGAGISIGLDFGDETHAGNIDFHYLPISAVAINNVIKDINKVYNLNLSPKVPSNSAFHLISIPVTYDYTAKFGGDLKFLIGAGVGLDLLLFDQDISNTVGGVTDKVIKSINFNIPVIPEFLLTSRIGFEWNATDWLAVGINLRGFIDLPIYYFSRGALDASAKITF